MKKIFYLLFIVPVLFFSFTLPSSGAGQRPLELITAQEAAAPDADPSTYTEISREEEGGPVIEVLAPVNGSEYRPPVPINVKFKGKDGKGIDLSTFRVEYLKFITLDITSKVRQYVTKDGINVPAANLPSGNHRIRLSVGDTAGRTTSRILTVAVQ